MFSASEMKYLADLLTPPDQDVSSSDEDLPKTISKMGPGDIGGKVKIKIRGNAQKQEDKILDVDPLSIWSLAEVPEVPFSDDADTDPRLKPECEIKFKQAVGSEDIFLQMSNKMPTTASCESMVISMILEGETKEDIDCHLTKCHLDIRSSKYRLSLPLPNPVDPDVCSAEWEPSTSRLSLNLTLNREYDFVNF